MPWATGAHCGGGKKGEGPMGVLTKVEISRRDDRSRLVVVNHGGGESSSLPRLLENGGVRPKVALDVVETREAGVPFIGADGESNGQKRRGCQRWWILKTSITRRL
jgi:hypothetical protein